jgi:hypothetical protein
MLLDLDILGFGGLGWCFLDLGTLWCLWDFGPSRFSALGAFTCFGALVLLGALGGSRAFLCFGCSRTFRLNVLHNKLNEYYIII